MADYRSPPLAALDFVETYLRSILGFVGITDVKFFNVQPMDISQDARKAALRKAVIEVRSWAADGAWDAAPAEAPPELPRDVKPQVILDQV